MRPGDTVSRLLITCNNKSAIDRSYTPAVRLGGWTGPIQVATPEDPVPSLDGVAGLLLAGGPDIHPRWWDPEEALDPTAEVDEARDHLEIPLAREAWRLGLPILGICRGEQLLNVALGGSLIQDIPSRCGLAPALHNRGTSQVPEEAHPVDLAPGSRLAAWAGTLAPVVNSRHHQAVLRVAPGLRAVAWWRGDDPAQALVEGVEAREDRPVLGVQWHPENLAGLDTPAGRAALGVFLGFVRSLT